jgi:transcriptional regulator GlxA family with amidase domain
VIVTVFVPDSPHAPHSLELVGVASIFSEANKQSRGIANYKLQVVGETGEHIRTASGVNVAPDLTIADHDGLIDTLIVIGASIVPPPPSGALVEWLRRSAPCSRRYGSTGTGAFTLGSAGLLRGRKLTTHWEYAAALAAMFPEATVLSDQIFVRDGPLFTSAGLTAALDLALALVEEDHGRALALTVAQRFIMFLKRPGGQSQFSPYLAGQIASRPPIQRAVEYIRNHPASDFTVPELARYVAMSERSFARAFMEETGFTPGAFLEATHVDVARRLLEETDLPAQSVAGMSGFGSVQALRSAFRRRLKQTPREYRERFQKATTQSGDGETAAANGH